MAQKSSTKKFRDEYGRIFLKTEKRRPGRTRLVYDKMKKTIMAVSASSSVATGLNISSEDADMCGQEGG